MFLPQIQTKRGMPRQEPSMFVAKCANTDILRLRFKPMQANQRAFIHALAEDYGLDSESQDPEPHRHVCIFKTPRFVSAPMKTLSQCVAIKPAVVPEQSRASSVSTVYFASLPIV